MPISSGFHGEEAGRGGVGGFLASDAGDENEFLTSSAAKMLAGYPVDSIPVTDLGKVHATPLFDESLTPAYGETWTTSDIYGMGGISGGPLFVRQSDGAFYPAAIYLGGDSQAVVRAIDSDVVELFLRAEASGNHTADTHPTTPPPRHEQQRPHRQGPMPAFCHNDTYLPNSVIRSWQHRHEAQQQHESPDN